VRDREKDRAGGWGDVVRSTTFVTIIINMWCIEYIKIELVPHRGHKIQSLSFTITSQLMLYSEIIAVWSQINSKHINTLCRQNVPLSKHSVSVIKTSQLMLYSDIIAICSQIHTKHIITLCGRTYRAVNTLRLGYKNQSVNAVQWNNRCLFSDPHKTHGSLKFIK
jgi:hypothetical protein